MSKKKKKVKSKLFGESNRGLVEEGRRKEYDKKKGTFSVYSIKKKTNLYAY